MRALRRRDFLKLSVLGVAGLAVVKVGGRAIMGVTPPARALPSLAHLSPRQAATVTAVAIGIVGERAAAAYDAGEWEPAADLDALLGGFPPDKRAELLLAITLFEEWTVGLTGFSSWSKEAQQARLEDWRSSEMGLKQSVWGFLHAGSTSSFGFSAPGWRATDYPGPSVGTGRPPGQSARFEWDEVVP